MRRWWAIGCALLVLCGCETKEVEREVGYKGKARINPWLAVERYATRVGWNVHSVIAWTPPERQDAIWLVPVSVLGNDSFARRMEEWVKGGGHLVLLVEHADAATNDWTGHAMPPEVKPALTAMLDRAGIELDCNDAVEDQEVKFSGRKFKVDAKSGFSVKAKAKKKVASTFVSRQQGTGRITVVTDSRIFRNRWVDGGQRAELLQALLDASPRRGRMGVMRGEGLSLWGLVSEYLWQLLLGLLVWLILWLWKNLSRFGPLESAVPPPILRGYDHHLEALGDFQWRLDRASSLLSPLRELVVDLGQRMSVRLGRRDEDFVHFLSDRSGLSPERVSKALSEHVPEDAGGLTRTTADLQRLYQVLTPKAQP